jgi:hypothetical protein
MCRCGGKARCTVPVNSSIFGEPCPGTHKYVEVHYTCVSPLGTSILAVVFVSPACSCCCCHCNNCCSQKNLFGNICEQCERVLILNLILMLLHLKHTYSNLCPHFISSSKGQYNDSVLVFNILANFILTKYFILFTFILTLQMPLFNKMFNANKFRVRSVG